MSTPQTTRRGFLQSVAAGVAGIAAAGNAFGAGAAGAQTAPIPPPVLLPTEDEAKRIAIVDWPWLPEGTTVEISDRPDLNARQIFMRVPRGKKAAWLATDLIGMDSPPAEVEDIAQMMLSRMRR